MPDTGPNPTESETPDVPRKLAESWPPEAWHDVTVLVAVSGGADSVALLAALCSLKRQGPGRLLAAHFNHHLRGEQSLADQRFVEALCGRLQIECELGGRDVAALAAEGGDSLEAVAREARYDFLQKTAARRGARYVVTAHTADDQAETILHHVLRGTGLAGLSGMPRARPLSQATTLIRPMLAIRRSQLQEYLSQLGQTYREDPSNQLLCFTRNRLRHQLLPLLAEQYNPRIVDALLRLGSLAAEAQCLIDELVEQLSDACVAHPHPRQLALDCGRLAAEPRYLVRELLIAQWCKRGWPQQAMGFQQWDQLATMVLADENAATEKQMFPGQITAERKGQQLTLTAPAA